MADKPTLAATLQPSPTFVTQLPNTSTAFSTSSSSKNDYANKMTSIAYPSGQDKKKPFDISNLMSPPELPPYESFAQNNMSNSRASAAPEFRRPLGPNPPLSPPISPLAKASNNLDNASPSVKDPILYPGHDLSVSPPQRPLFSRDESIERQRLVDEHVYTRPSTLFLESPPPKREDYELVLYFQSQVMKKYQESPKQWLQRERAQLLADRRAGARHNNFRLHPILPAKPQPIRAHAQGVSKPERKPKPAQSHTVRSIRVNPNPPPRVQNTIRVSATPDREKPARTVAPNREDKAFDTIPDYCPPLSSLPNKPNSLKVDWKGAPIDLSNDPHRNLLHPDELSLAAGLRLDCATYLTSKRRMFERRLECLRVGKEFRKTDAQQACKIDVNKASKLWTAFEKVGWLNHQWVGKFLRH